jgi:hypothetical protein
VNEIQENDREKMEALDEGGKENLILVSQLYQMYK